MFVIGVKKVGFTEDGSLPEFKRCDKCNKTIVLGKQLVMIGEHAPIFENGHAKEWEHPERAFGQIQRLCSDCARPLLANYNGFDMDMLKD